MNSFFLSKRRSKGFSLVEVVVAVGIFAISIVAVIGLLGPTNKSVADVRDTDDATRVVNAIQAQLQTMAETSAGWTQLTSSTASVRLLRLSSEVTTDDTAPIKDLTTTDYTLYATRDGSRIHIYKDSGTYWNGSSPSDPTTPIPNWDGIKYFEITLIRNGDYPAVGNGLSPAANDATAGFLAFTIRLRWPAFLPNGQKFADNTQKSVLLVPAAVHR